MQHERLVPFVVRLLPSQVEFLRDCENGAEFVRQAITEKMEQRRDQIFAKEREKLVGHPTREALSQAPLVSPPRVIVITVPEAVWGDEALKAKLEVGWSLDEVRSFLRAQIHPKFAETVQSHSEVDYSAEYGKMWVGTRPETAGNQPETKQEENFAGGQ
jgi:hypothetical protein